MHSQFYIMNEKKGRWGLNHSETGVFVDPSGFGVDYNNGYLKTGDIWVANENELEQPSPAGTIVFGGKDIYAVFQQFMNFINAAKELVFIYHPAGLEKEYFTNVDIISVEKGGYSASRRVLEVPVKFVCRSLFYTEEKFEYHIQRASKEVRWDFRWETKFNDLNYVYFDFINDGHVENPFQVSFTGYCTFPEITVYQDGKLIHHVKFYITLQRDERLTFSTFDDDLFVEVNGVDRKECLDFTSDNFFKLPIGRSEIYFRSQTGKMNNIILNIEKYYKGV